MIETCRAVAFPWLCDQVGHLNTSKYVEMFDVAAHHLFNHIGAPAGGMGMLAWADVRHEIDYRNEVAVGGLVVIDSTVLQVGRTSLKARHLMRDAGRTREHAVMVAVTVCFDTAQRQAAPLPSEIAERARAMTALNANIEQEV